MGRLLTFDIIISDFCLRANLSPSHPKQGQEQEQEQEQEKEQEQQVQNHCDKTYTCLGVGEHGRGGHLSTNENGCVACLKPSRTCHHQ